MIKVFFYFILPLAFSFYSCELKEIEKPFPQVNKIKMEKKYKINLPEEHSSGYIWQLSENYDMTKISHLNTVWHGNKKGVNFNFAPIAAGQTTLTFILRKYNDTSDIKQFIVQIADE